jgi:hypothetical protein
VKRDGVIGRKFGSRGKRRTELVQQIAKPPRIRFGGAI